jgi:hypothetical protein
LPYLYGISLYQCFVDNLQKPIYSESIKRPTFPGFEAVFGIEWPPYSTIMRVIDKNALMEKLEIEGLKERIYRVVNLYLDEIKKVQDEEEARIDLWFVVVPEKLWRKCRPKSQDKLRVERKSLEAYQAGQQSLFSEINEEYEALTKILDLNSDFHHQLKARLLQEKINIGGFCTTPRKGALRESSGQKHLRIEAVML